MSEAYSGQQHALLDAVKQRKKEFQDTPFYETEIKYGAASIALQQPKQKALKRVFGEILDSAPIAIKEPAGSRDNFSYGMNLLTGEVFVVIAEHSRATMQSIQDFGGVIEHPMQPGVQLPVLHVAPDDFAEAYIHDQGNDPAYRRQLNLQQVSRLQTTSAIHYLGAKTKEDLMKLATGVSVMTSESYHSLIRPAVQDKFGTYHNNVLHYKRGNVEPSMMWSPGIDVIGDIIDSGGSLYGDKWEDEALSAYKKHFNIKSDVGVGIPYLLPIGVSSPGLWVNRHAMANLSEAQHQSLSLLTNILVESSRQTFPECTLSAQEIADHLISPGSYADPETLEAAIWNREDLLLATGRTKALKKNGFANHSLPEGKEIILEPRADDFDKKDTARRTTLLCAEAMESPTQTVLPFAQAANQNTVIQLPRFPFTGRQRDPACGIEASL